MTAQQLSSHEARDTSRLSPELLNKQQVAASKWIVITELDSPQIGECAQGGVQLQGGQR